jgi:DNA primase
VPGIDFRLARQGVRITEVLELIGFEPRRLLGVQARGPCPLHGSRSARSRVFAVHLSKQLYHCFACGAGGNALDLWAAWSKQDLHAATVDLYQRLGREIPWLSSKGSSRSLERPPSREECQAMPDP